jgi:L-rhamnose mutarotase
MKNQKAPIVIENVTYSMFSIARHYGGCKAFGTVYYYHHFQDALIRRDYLKKMKQCRTWEAFMELLNKEQEDKGSVANTLNQGTKS